MTNRRDQIATKIKTKIRHLTPTELEAIVDGIEALERPEIRLSEIAQKMEGVRRAGTDDASWPNFRQRLAKSVYELVNR